MVSRAHVWTAHMAHDQDVDSAYINAVKQASGLSGKQVRFLLLNVVCGLRAIARGILQELVPCCG